MTWSLKDASDGVVATLKLSTGPQTKLEFGKDTTNEVVIDPTLQEGDLIHVSLACLDGTYKVKQKRRSYRFESEGILFSKER